MGIGDNIRAVDAKFEAQKIAFAPLAFQAIKTMLNLNIMQAISDAGDDGITRKELADKTILLLNEKLNNNPDEKLLEELKNSILLYTDSEGK